MTYRERPIEQQLDSARPPAWLDAGKIDLLVGEGAVRFTHRRKGRPPLVYCRWVDEDFGVCWWREDVLIARLQVDQLDA